MTGRLPCPFCGMRPFARPGLEGYTVGCGRSRCPVRPVTVAPSPEQAVQAWNTRPPHKAWRRMFDAALEVMVQIRDNAKNRGESIEAAARRFIGKRIGHLVGLQRRAEQLGLTDEIIIAMMDGLEDCQPEIERRRKAKGRA